MTATECSVRDRRDADLPILAESLVRVHARDGYPVEGVEDPVAWLQHPNALWSWVAVAGSVPIGQVTLVDASEGDEAARSWAAYTDGSMADLAIIVRLFVDTDYRTLGAGRLLMVTALDYARQIGRAVALDVMVKDQGAIRLYERLGACRIDEIVHRHSDDRAEPAFVYYFP